MSPGTTEWPRLSPPPPAEGEQAPTTPQAMCMWWHGGAVDAEVWPPTGYRILRLAGSCRHRADATATAAELLAQHRWRVVGPWREYGLRWWANVAPIEEPR